MATNVHVNASSAVDVRELLRNLSKQDFRNLGLAQVAYIRPFSVDDKMAFAIYAADGSRLTVEETPGGAAMAIHQNDLEPMTVH